MRRTGFKKTSYQRKPRQPLEPISPEISARFKAVPVAQEVTAVPKSEAQRNPALLKMAYRRPCLFRLPGCDGGGETTVAAHSNHSEHGKAGARKADDQYSAWSCFHCHSQYDQGRATAEEKRGWFDVAHARQVKEWRWMVSPMGSIAESNDKIEAARWALERLDDEPSTGH